MIEDRQLRARLEELQAAIKEANEELSRPLDAEHLARLEALRDESDTEERAALALERDLRVADEGNAVTRHRVELAEQEVLSRKTMRDVPIVTTVMTIAGLLGAVWLSTWVLHLPRTPELELAVKAVAAVALVPIAWFLKRRL